MVYSNFEMFSKLNHSTSYLIFSGNTLEGTLRTMLIFLGSSQSSPISIQGQTDISPEELAPLSVTLKPGEIKPLTTAYAGLGDTEAGWQRP